MVLVFVVLYGMCFFAVCLGLGTCVVWVLRGVEFAGGFGWFGALRCLLGSAILVLVDGFCVVALRCGLVVWVAGSWFVVGFSLVVCCGVVSVCFGWAGAFRFLPVCWLCVCLCCLFMTRRAFACCSVLRVVWFV